MRPTWCDIDLGAIRHNVGAIKGHVGDSLVCAVVKADGYGHGATAVARAAVDAGANWLAVATVDEGVTLRRAGVVAPILLLSEPSPVEMVEVVAASLTPTVYTGEGLAAAAAAANQSTEQLPVQLKINTGMNRVGAAPADAVALADAIADKPSLQLQGVWTHCAVADEPDDPFTDGQLDKFESVVGALAAAGHRPELRHAANSAATMYHSRSHYDMVRVGIATYGIAPSPTVEEPLGLRPALRLVSRVAMIKEIQAGERVSYGLRWEADQPTRIATIPIGYADGVRRSLSKAGGEVLIGGKRYPMVGTVTMDQLMVDCGHDTDVQPGDEVVLVGAQDGDEISANEVGLKLDTIGYEVVCDVESRVPRRYR